MHQNELDILSSLNSESIVKIIDVHYKNESAHIVMELCDGTLEQHLDSIRASKNCFMHMDNVYIVLQVYSLCLSHSLLH